MQNTENDYGLMGLKQIFQRFCGCVALVHIHSIAEEIIRLLKST